uniref:Milk fat globule EGF and factor V/VIII domain containing n=1 Tax=Chelonoidis abingdonii TaxID=106734 RepID=A0A8C0IL13_CHEAB
MPHSALLPALLGYRSRGWKEECSLLHLLLKEGPCHSNPCHNNGECQLLPNRGDVFVEYVCKCPAGYAGTHCQKSCAVLLGMEGRAIADAQLSASSVYYGFLGLQRWGPELARLNNNGIVNAWTSSNYDKNPWIQVNLLRKMRLTGILTQGARRAGWAEYVHTFKVAHSLDGRVFVFYRDENQDRDKVFPGNTNNDGMKSNVFNPPITAQYIRIYPVMCHRACTLRFELVGCELNGCSEPLGMKSRLISDQQITASSIYKTWGIDGFTWYPHYARLDKTGKTNAWTALNNDQSEWLQIFQGNYDNTSHKKNVFEVPFYARFVRILPVAWHNRITLRMELLGCDE